MSVEKGCEWHFGTEGGIDIGPNDPIHQTFKGNAYYSIVREAIQNSLDAVDNDSEPVHVSFTYFELDRLQHPNFFKLEEHISQSSSYYNGNPDAARLFKDMLFYLNGDQEGKKKLKVSCLRISDSNTKGMKYVKDETDSPFYAFLRAAGVSAKPDSGSGGSFGFGKGAYFALSPIKTLVVSTRDLDGNVWFEGTTRLTTHRNESNQKLTAYGFYDNNNGEPTVNSENIPEVFKRETPGTDVNVIGLWEERDQNKLMVKPVLNNFFLAIHDKKLSVTIEDVEINADNLGVVIEEYFQNEFESGRASDIDQWNPLPYYKAVKNANASAKFKHYSKELDTLGTVDLFVYLNNKLPNRIAYFRKPRMVVKKETNNKVKGYCAVFVCDDKRGNDILRLMENPAHNVWDIENYLKVEGKVNKIARKAKNELSSFINSTLDELSKAKIEKQTSILGLEEYLYSTEDLLDNEEDLENEGMSNSLAGRNIGELAENETGEQTTQELNPKVTIIGTETKPDEIIEDDVDVEPDEDGEEKVTTGGENESGGGDREGDGDGGAGTGTDSNDSEGSKLFLDIVLRVVAQKENDKLYHSLIINSPRVVQNAEIELLVGADNERDDGIAITSTDNGTTDQNVLRGVVLTQGRNIVKVRFSDNVKHSIKVKAYEIQ